MISSKKADELFKKELTKAEVESAAHLTYRDGFRLGFGIFVGLMAALTLLVLIIWGVSALVKLF